MQWVSTFASGASSLGRPRRLAGHPTESGPPSFQGTFGENSPHLQGNIDKRKSKKKSCGQELLSAKPLGSDGPLTSSPNSQTYGHRSARAPASQFRA